MTDSKTFFILPRWRDICTAKKEGGNNITRFGRLQKEEEKSNKVRHPPPRFSLSLSVCLFLPRVDAVFDSHCLRYDIHCGRMAKEVQNVNRIYPPEDWRDFESPPPLLLVSVPSFLLLFLACLGPLYSAPGRKRREVEEYKELILPPSYLL